jgi:hypothetical protein
MLLENAMGAMFSERIYVCRATSWKSSKSSIVVWYGQVPPTSWTNLLLSYAFQACGEGPHQKCHVGLYRCDWKDLYALKNGLGYFMMVHRCFVEVMCPTPSSVKKAFDLRLQHQDNLSPTPTFLVLSLDYCFYSG